MKLMRFSAALMLACSMSAPAAAQSAVTVSDLQRLQDNIYDTSRDIAQVRARDSSLASQLQAELDDARDESVYLKVKQRKHEPIATVEYQDLRDKIENIRDRARGESRGGYSPSPTYRDGDYTPPPVYRDSDARPAGTIGRSTNPNEIPVGTEFDVRLQTSLSSRTAQVEDRFEATTLVDLNDGNGRVLIPAGSLMRGIVSSVTRATRLERTGRLTVAFDRVTIHGRSYPMRGTVSQALQSEGIMGEKEKIGIGAGAGAILGAILGGAKGALAGILIGGGGTIAATEGKDVELPVGTMLRVRLDSPLTLQK